MKIQIKNRKVFLLFVMSFFVTLLFPVLIIIIAFNSYFIDAYKNNITQQNKMNLNMYELKIDSLMQNCIAISIQLPNADGFSYQQLTSFETAYSKIAKILKAYQIAQDYYDEVTFYSFIQKGTVFTSVGTLNPTYYYRYGEAQIPLDQLLVDKISPFWIQTVDNRIGKENNIIIQYIMPVVGTSTDFILFNINEQIFIDISAGDAIVNEIYFENNLIYSTNLIENKEKMQVISNVSEITGLEYRRYVPTDVLMKNVKTMQLVFVYMITAIVIVGSLLVYFISVARYLPIKRLTLLAKDVLHDGPKSIGELEYISFAINHIGIKNEEYLLKDKLKKLFYSIIYKQYKNIETITDKCVQVSLFLEGKKWRTAILSIDSEGSVDNKDIDVLCCSVLETNYEVYFLDYSSKKHFIIILGNEQDNIDLLRGKLEAILEKLHSELNCKGCFSVGGCCESVVGLSKSYNEAIVISGENSLVNDDISFYEFFETREKRLAIYPKIELESLGISIIESDIERISFFTNVLSESISNQNFNDFTRVSICHEIINTYFKALEELSINNVTLNEIESIVDSIQLSSSTDDYVDIIRKLQKVTLTAISTVGNPQVMQENDEIKQFVDNHEDIKQLCVGFVAEHFGISISNLSHRFKSQTGINISNYIVMKRIDCAKVLLTQTDMNLSEVAEKLSYCHTNSFMRVFKSIVGVTPGEYRKKFTHRS